MIPRLFLLISIFSLPIFADNSNASFKVQSGDTLWSISRQLDIPVKELIELNSFRVFSSGAPNIQIGQLIKLKEHQTMMLGIIAIQSLHLMALIFQQL